MENRIEKDKIYIEKPLLPEYRILLFDNIETKYKRYCDLVLLPTISDNDNIQPLYFDSKKTILVNNLNGVRNVIPDTMVEKQTLLLNVCIFIRKLRLKTMNLGWSLESGLPLAPGDILKIVEKFNYKGRELELGDKNEVILLPNGMLILGFDDGININKGIEISREVYLTCLEKD